MKTIFLTALLSTALAASAAQPRIVKPGQVFGGDYRSESESFIAWVSVLVYFQSWRSYLVRHHSFRNVSVQ